MLPHTPDWEFHAGSVFDSRFWVDGRLNQAAFSRGKPSSSLSTPKSTGAETPYSSVAPSRWPSLFATWWGCWPGHICSASVSTHPAGASHLLPPSCRPPATLSPRRPCVTRLPTYLQQALPAPQSPRSPRPPPPSGMGVGRFQEQRCRPMGTPWCSRPFPPATPASH